MHCKHLTCLGKMIFKTKNWGWNVKLEKDRFMKDLWTMDFRLVSEEDADIEEE